VVLPNLPLLNFISFHLCTLHPRWLRLLLSSMPDTRPRGGLSLGLVHTPAPRDSCRAIASVIGCGALGGILVEQARLEASGCALLVQSAAASRDLWACTVVDCPRTLTINEETWADDAMSGASSMRVLSIGAGWTDRGLSELFRQLRANVSLESLNIQGDVSEGLLFGLLEELLSTYNFTIERVGGVRLPSGHRRRIDALLRRNQGVRTMNDQLQSRNYHVGEPKLWPRVLHDIGAFPTLVHRFLRQGNAVALADQLRSRSGRRRRPADR
jgi:hypothetical protein